MALSLTDDTHVALYDTVSGAAFGWVFESRAHAEDFYEWCEDDPRMLDAASLEKAMENWKAERCDADGGLLTKGA